MLSQPKACFGYCINAICCVTGDVTHRAAPVQPGIIFINVQTTTGGTVTAQLAVIIIVIADIMGLRNSGDTLF